LLHARPCANFTIQQNPVFSQAVHPGGNKKNEEVGMSFIPGITKDRRHGPDWLVHAIRYLGVASWAILLLALILVEKARPQLEKYLDKTMNIQLRQSWNLEFIRFLFYLMILGLCLSIVGFAVNTMRKQRRTDEYRLSLIFLGLISIGTIIYCLLTL